MRELISVLETRLDKPSAKALAYAVTRAIRDGALQPGERMPPVRELAHQLAMSPTTVNSAWGMLTRAGTLITAGRRGTVVADVHAPRARRYREVLNHDIFRTDLSTGVPDAGLLPSLGSAMHELTSAGTPATYLDDPVLPDLRSHLLESWPYPAASLTVVDGAMDALELIIRATLTFGDRVLVEDPTFPPLLDLLEAAGVVVHAVPIDDYGPVPSELTAALAAGVRAVFVQPRAHNPTGVSMRPDRIAELADVLRTHEVLIVEDDSAAAVSTSPDLSFGKLLPDHTVHIRSFSKSHGPDLRLAAVSGPEDLIGSVQRLRQLGQGWSSRLLQRVLLHLLEDPTAQDTVDRARVEYARRRSTFVDVLATAGIPTLGGDGLNVWVPVHDETAAVMRLAAQGIAVAPGRPFTVGSNGQAHVRVTTGLVTEGGAELAELVVMAAHTSGRSSTMR